MREAMYEFIGYPVHPESFGEPVSQAHTVISRKRLYRLIRDHNDMYNAYQTSFHRCSCGPA